MECKNCKKEAGYLESYCDDCRTIKRKRYIIMAGVFLAIGIILGSISGLVGFNYELGKCDSLTSKQSNYDFTNRIEIDADFNQHCYYLENHPLALFGNIIRDIMMIEFLVIFIMLMFSLVRLHSEY